jgi:hypothetical protein
LEERNTPFDPAFIWIPAAVLATRIAGLYCMNLFDDAFITFRHAVNLAAGRGMVFNAGSSVLGTTCPLFALLLAGTRAIGLAPTYASVALGLAADSATALLGFAILRKEIGKTAAVAFVLCFAVDPHIIRIAVGGMESSPFLFGTLLWAWMLAGGKERAALFLSSFLVFIRPEAALLGLLALVTVWRRGRGIRSLQWTAAAAVVVGAGTLLLWRTYGAFLPQSVISKGHQVESSLVNVLRVFFFPNGAYGQWVLTILAIVGLRWAVAASSALGWYAVWIAGYIGAYLLARPHMWTWYGLPVYGAKALLAGAAIGSLYAPWSGLAKRVLTPPVVTIVAIAGALAMIGIVGPSPVRRGIYDPLAQWCEENVDPGQTIAAGDIGAIGYYSSGYIYDLGGLVWPERWEYRRMMDVIEFKKPDFVFAEVTDVYRELYDPGSELRRHYAPEKRFSRFGQFDVNPDPNGLAHGWIQDYVIFRRVSPSDD